jgi:hypothetical protein
MPQFDLYAEENKPESKEFYKTYTVNVPSQSNDVPMKRIGVRLAVYRDGLVNIDSFSWFGVYGPKQANANYSDPKQQKAAIQEIWEWLTEWGLVKLQRIGPEDSEYFATSDLTGDKEHDREY